MKKALLKMIVFALTFVLAVIIFSKLRNTGHDNLTVEMSPATLPLVTMEYEGTPYNQLHGYVREMNVTLISDCVTALDETRGVKVSVDTFGQTVSQASYALRSIDGKRLIEDTRVEEYEETESGLAFRIVLKDLIERDREYSLTLTLTLGDGREVCYYTAVVWSDSLHTAEKLAFVMDFHNRTFDRAAAQEISRYLETNARLEDNTSFHRVNIHSSLQQITWGDLGVRRIGEPVVRLTGIDPSIATFLLRYTVANPGEEDPVEYTVEEYYRVRYTKDRMYLLDFERTMTEIPVPERMYANDKFLLGIADENVDMMESEDGNMVVFQNANQLFCYDIAANKLICLFSFYDAENDDIRNRCSDHAIRIIDVDEVGNVCFAVYGYMNRGRHEGEVGVQIVSYSNRHNTLEELLYLPYDKPYPALAAEVEHLLYVNRDGKLYLEFDRTVYCVDLSERTCHAMLQVNHDGQMLVSENHEIAVWTEGEDTYHSRVMNIQDLVQDIKYVVYGASDEAVMPLGFMDSDIIFGVAKTADIVKEKTGGYFFPMYKICICSAQGEVLKQYEQSDVYITDCHVGSNQITLKCLERSENGTYHEIPDEHITNNVVAAAAKNTVVATDIDVYKRYVQIKVRKTIDTKSIKILHPKEVVYEGGRSLELPGFEGGGLYYAYGPYGIEGVYTSSASAVAAASGSNGRVVDENGRLIWKKENRSTKNQIMALKEVKATEEKSSTAVCLESILQFNGLAVNAQALLDEGQTPMEILSTAMENDVILNLTGCDLNSVLYYVDHEVPILVLLEDGSCVLITGFNEFNTVILDPVKGTLAKKGMNDSKEWFAENGNRFISYVPPENQ